MEGGRFPMTLGRGEFFTCQPRVGEDTLTIGMTYSREFLEELDLVSISSYAREKKARGNKEEDRKKG